MRKPKNDDQVTTETKKASEQLEMWASAMGLSTDDIKNIKMGAIQDLVEEAEEEKLNCSGCSCKCKDKSGFGENVLTNILPYMTMLGALNTVQALPPITIHVHVDK